MTFRLAVTLVACLALSGCGDDAVTSATPPVDVAGTWSFRMTLEVVRLADGYRALLWCPGTGALTQEPGTGALRGAVRYGYRCAGGSQLSGSINGAGKVAFRMDGFKPYEPPDTPCPDAKDVPLSGEASKSADTTSLYATGATRVSCGVLGDHDFTYTLQGWRDR